MAASISYTGSNSVWGNFRVSFGVITMTDQASGAVEIPGMKTLVHALVTRGSAMGVADSYTVNINTNSGGSTVGGWLQIKSGVSANVFNVLAIGN